MLPDAKTSKRDNHDFIATVFFNSYVGKALMKTQQLR